jgi:hypothetical protein
LGGKDASARIAVQEGSMDLLFSGTFWWVYLFFAVGYYVFVPYMLWMIWQKVRHLPS